MNKNLLFVLLFLTALIIVSSINADVPKDYSPVSTSASVQTGFLQTNNLNVAVSSDGIISYDRYTFTTGTAGLIWPVSTNQRLTMDYAAGLWIGAKVGPSRELRTAASLHASHYSPGNIPVIGQVPPTSVCSDPRLKLYLVSLDDPNLFNGGVRNKVAGNRTYSILYDSWAAWPVDLGAPYIEVNGIPGYQPELNGDRPGIWHTTARPNELMFSVYMDYTNCTGGLHTSAISLPGGTLPLGVEVQQLTFSFSDSPYRDMYFSKWRIINKSSLSWDSVYIALVDDGDIGNGEDDAAGCDTTRDLGYIYNFDNNDVDYGASPPALGYRILQSPMRFTGNNQDTAKLPYGNYTGYKLTGMSAYNVFVSTGGSCLGDPNNAAAAYNFLKGKDGCGNTMINWAREHPTTYKYSGIAFQQLGWYDSSAGDKRQILSCGPFSMNSGNEQYIVSGVIAGRSSSNLTSLSAMIDNSNQAKLFYNNSFGGTPIGITQTSTEVPVRFSLEQNYPNPFNPATTIRFSVMPNVKAQMSKVELTVYDALGRSVAMLVNDRLAAGTYSYEWNAANFPSGIYFYELKTEGFTKTKKMVMIK
ncbi:MAG: T9SS type A sorting domain-containing protein [Ignavibacteria bacterium]|nr:T9SS type A sorting domain-containing protein [Ignavibacteria bacterium]